MGLLEDIQAKADANGDGKLSMEDLQNMRDSLPEGKFEELSAKADANGDGKVSFEDVKDMDWGGLADDAKNTFGNLFN